MYTEHQVSRATSSLLKILNVGSEEIQKITQNEIETGLSVMKNKKAPGEDGINIESIKCRGDKLLNVLPKE